MLSTLDRPKATAPVPDRPNGLTRKRLSLSEVSDFLGHRLIGKLLTRVYQSRSGLWLPDFDAVIRRTDNVFALLGKPWGDLILIPGCNIVTDTGDVFFAQVGAQASPTNGFTTWEMCTAGTPGKAAIRSTFTVIAGSQLVQDATYPKANDGDADNTGAGTKVRTSRVSYTAASFNNAAITHGLITNASPAAGEPLLAGWAWSSSINKTSQDTLKCFHNASMSGI
jgi:hypothetical protein